MAHRRSAASDDAPAQQHPPSTYRPQLPLLVKAAPPGESWLHEVKYDGFRIGCRIAGGRVSLISRNGKDWTGMFPEIRDAAARLPVRAALLDGEVAILKPDGRSDFQALQNASGGGLRQNLVYLVFDLLHLDGKDIGALPLERRKETLADLLRSGRRDASRLHYSDHVTGDGSRVFAEACRLGLEGVVSKRRDLPYRPGRHDGWVKVKCVKRQEFVIGGFTDPEGSRVGLGALLTGHYDTDGRLVFAGKVGTGFTLAGARDLRARLEQLARQRCPFDVPPPGSLGRRAHWVAPELVAEVAFTEWTADGKIRHPSYQGLRKDKRPADVVREEPASPPSDILPEPPITRVRHAESVPRTTVAAPSPPVRTSGGVSRAKRVKRAESAEVAGVRISNPQRVVFPDAGLTKLDVALYYEKMAGHILPHLNGRPLTLVRCPEGLDGGCFYMKHSNLWAPAALKKVQIKERTKSGQYLVVDSLPGLISLVQMGVLEIHTWNARLPDIERPDRLVFDIDPGPGVAWRKTVEAARLVRDMLRALALESFVKTTGGAGLHVVVPLVPGAGWDDCLEFSRAIARLIVRHDPALYTVSFRKAGREDRILIDYLRNNRTSTSVAAFSTRAKPRAPVSLPVRWEEVAALSSDRYTVSTVSSRLTRLKTDPWERYLTVRQSLGEKHRHALRQLE
jgi:bifunctional non-homologous end joining protein LigD